MKRTKRGTNGGERWWWERDPDLGNEPNWRWNEAALLYEARARARGEDFIPYAELPFLERVKVLADHGYPGRYAFYISRTTSDANKKPEAGWSEYRAISWNLNATDKTLAKQFLQYVHEWRQQKNIPKPKQNPANKPKPLPWNVLKIWDLGAKNESQASQLRKFKKKYIPDLD